MFYEKLYQINNNPHLYTKHNLLLVLGSGSFNAAYSEISIHEYCNVHHVYKNIYENDKPSSLTVICQSKHQLSDLQVSNFIIQGQNIINSINNKIKKYDYICQHYNQTHPDNYDDNELNQILIKKLGPKYYQQINMYENIQQSVEPTPVENDIRYFYNPQNFRWHFSKSHSNRGNFGIGRVGHPQHTFAVDNYFGKIQKQKLNKQYPNTKIGHLNRKVNRKHTENFPVFDDPEYCESRHSTGWKHSSKARHQYLQHAKQQHYQDWQFNAKRTLTLNLNN